MKEGEKKKIYYNLRTNNVVVEKQEESWCPSLRRCTIYTFGQYQVRDYDRNIDICVFSTRSGVHVLLDNASYYYGGYENEQDKDVYAIAIAAKNKASGKEYIDPYKNIPVNKTIKDSVNTFNKIFTEYAADIFPYDMPKQQYTKTIAEIRNIFAQKMKQYKTK